LLVIFSLVLFHIFSFIIRLEARLRSNTGYWIYIYSTGQFGGVHAFGYNSAERERMWMKSEALSTLLEAALADFARDLRSI